jgi:hypothetical protein
MQHGSKLALALILAAAIQPAFAETSGSTLEALNTCRQEADPAVRVTCYDDAVARLNAEISRGDTVVVDRQQAEAARQQSFGLGDSSQPAAVPPSVAASEIERQTDTVAEAVQMGDKRWKITTSSGAVWLQTDGRLARRPKPGAPVELIAGTLGNFTMKVDGQFPVKAKRVR